MKQAKNTIIIDANNTIFENLGVDFDQNYEEYMNLCNKKYMADQKSTVPMKIAEDGGIVLDFHLRKLTCLCTLPEKLTEVQLQFFHLFPQLEKFEYLILSPDVSNICVGCHEGNEILNYKNFIKCLDKISTKQEPKKELVKSRIQI